MLVPQDLMYNTSQWSDMHFLGMEGMQGRNSRRVLISLSLVVWRKEQTLPLFNIDRALPCKGRASRPHRGVGNLQTCCLYSGLRKGVDGSSCILANQKETLPWERVPRAAILLLSLTERIYSATCGCKVWENWGSQPPASEECISWCCWKGRTENATATCTANI